jgi:type VI secretion system protein ImpA
MAVDLGFAAAKVSDEAPCGPNLEDDARYRGLSRQLDEIIERDAQAIADAPDDAAKEAMREAPVNASTAAEAAGAAAALLAESRDLWVAAAGYQCAVLAGDPASAASFAEAAAVMCETHWPELWPALQAADPAPAFVRLNAMNEIGSFGRSVKFLDRLPIAPLRAAVRLTWRSILSKVPDKATGAQILAGVPAGLAEAIARSDLAAWTALRDQFETIRSSARRIAEAFAANGAEAPSFERLDGTLGRILSLVEAIIVSKNPGEPASGAMLAAGPAASAAPPGPAAGREQALAMIEGARAWFAAAEPSSPVPLLLERAKRLAGMNFAQLVQNLAPGGVDEMSRILEPVPPETQA